MEERSNPFHGRDGRGVGNRAVAVPLSRRKNSQRNGHGTRGTGAVEPWPRSRAAALAMRSNGPKAQVKRSISTHLESTVTATLYTERIIQFCFRVAVNLRDVGLHVAQACTSRAIPPFQALNESIAGRIKSD
jgi:hypothetical protein